MGSNHLHFYLVRWLSIVPSSFAVGDELSFSADKAEGYDRRLSYKGRHGKVLLGVLNEFRGDPSKWFWVGGAWKSAAIDNPIMEIDIPTGFGSKIRVSLKEAADREQAANQKVAALDRVARELADLKGEMEEVKLDPYSNVAQTRKFAYYMAYADVIRVAKGSGLDVGPLVEAFKAYVPLHPLNPTFVLPILDLSMEHGVDLSWYPQRDNLADPAALMNTAQGESIAEDGGAEADPPAGQD
ncbi:hypothetical protein OROMI_001215 [Orobanche minor]